MRPKEWADPEVLTGRAYFRLGGVVGSLVLNSTTKADEAVYRCRVDFKRQTTTHFRVNLTVVEPISSVRIKDSSGDLLVGVAGPYTVGQIPTIACEVIGGDPAPVISWWKNGKMLDNTYLSPSNARRPKVSPLSRSTGLNSRGFNHLSPSFESLSSSGSPTSHGRVTLSTIELNPLTKEDLRTTYTCRAQNHHMAPTREASIEIDMNFGPSSVEIKGLEGPASAGKLLSVACEAKGSRPPATLTWWLDGTMLSSTSQVTSLDGKISKSSLELTLKPEDAGRKLTCRAENGHLPAATIEHSLALQVLYPPRVSLKPGSSLNLSNIKEKDDVYFDCDVKARPKPFKISWLFNGKPLEQDLAKNIMVIGESLVLQKVTRNQAGNYSCFASNSQGSNSSEPIYLSIKYAPVCRVEQTDVYGVGRLEKTTVTCRVEADPPATSYRWAFNNTGEFVDIPMSNYAIKRDDDLGQRSDLRYSPISDLDYGTLLCWATNEVGIQKIPCTFTVFPAGKPDAVGSCKQINHTEESVAVVCEPGYGGGMNQSFLLEAWDDGALRAMVREDSPSLEVTGLRPGTRYTLKVYAENTMGRSQPTSFIAFTLTDVAERRTAIGVGDQTEDMNPVLGSIFGGIASVLILILVGFVLARCKRRNSVNNHRRNEISAANKDESFDSANFEQEITKVESPLPGDSVAPGKETAPVCDLVSTSQDSMLMSRSQDSSTPLIGNPKTCQFQASSPPFQSSSDFQTPTSSQISDKYLPGSLKDVVSYTKLSSQPLEPSAFKDFPNTGSKTLSYRQLRNTTPPNPVSYVSVMNYPSHIQQSDVPWGDQLPHAGYVDESGAIGAGFISSRCGNSESSCMPPSSTIETRRHSSYLRSLQSMSGQCPRGSASKGDEHIQDISQRPYQMSPTEGGPQQPLLRPTHSNNFSSSVPADQSLNLPLSLSSQQESSV